MISFHLPLKQDVFKGNIQCEINSCISYRCEEPPSRRVDRTGSEKSVSIGVRNRLVLVRTRRVGVVDRDLISFEARVTDGGAACVQWRMFDEADGWNNRCSAALNGSSPSRPNEPADEQDEHADHHNARETSNENTDQIRARCYKKEFTCPGQTMRVFTSRRRSRRRTCRSGFVVCLTCNKRHDLTSRECRSGPSSAFDDY